MGQPSDVLEEKIRVFVRSRPPQPDDDAAPPEDGGGFFLGGGDVAPASPASCLDEWSADGRVVYRKPGASPESARAFQFSGVFGPEATQADVYAACAADVVAAAAAGYNGTVVAYGQTGAGKTHTMRGVEAPGKALHADAGVVPRALRDLFAAQGAAARDGVELSVSVSYVQIYCEALLDLLDPSSAGNLSIRERPAHAGGGVFVEGLARVPAESAEAAWDLLAAGDARRATAATSRNAASSRSHACFLVHVERRPRLGPRGTSGDVPPRRSTLTLVDLAGSERAAAVAGKPQRLEECKAINASLAALGNCVAALAKGRPHVPYRDSKLTRLLSASLGGAARTSLVAALVPGGDAGGESRSTLEFAGRAARVAVRAAPAEVAVDYEALHAEAAARVDALEAGQQKGATFPTSKAHISAIFHSFRLTFGRAIISRNGLEARMPFSGTRARGTLTLKRR